MSVFILIILAIGGLIFDAGMAMVYKSELDHASEVAAEKAAIMSYDRVLYDNTGTLKLVEDDTKDNLIKYLDICMPEASITTTLFKPDKPYEVYVSTKYDYDTYFMKIFGIETIRLTSDCRGYVYE